MIILGTGIYEEEKDGKTYGFYFGTRSAYIIEQLTGESYTKVFREMSSENEGKQMTRTLQYWNGIQSAYAQRHKVTLPTMDDTMDMYEHLGEEKLAEIMYKAHAAYLPKNDPAPKEGQETIPV